jgi:hypothetical protein
VLYYSLTTSMLAYCQIFALLMVPAQWVAVSVLSSRNKFLKFLAIGTIIIGILILPMLLMLFRAVQRSTFWYSLPDVLVILHQLCARFINLPLRQLGPIRHSMIVLAIIVAIPVALPFVGVVSGLIKELDPSKLFAYACVVLAATFPFSYLLLFSLLIKPVYVIRYVLPSLPFFLLLAAGLCELRPNLMRPGFALLLTANVFGTLEYYRVPTKPDWRSVAQYLIMEVQAGDKLAVIPGGEWYTLKYNLARLGSSGWSSTLVFPNCGAENVYQCAVAGPAVVSSGPITSRLWTIEINDAPDYSDRPIVEHLSRRYPFSCHREFRDISVRIYSLNDGEGCNCGPPRPTSSAAPANRAKH